MNSMKMQSFLTDLAELLEVEVSELDVNYQLDENANWDSLALIAVVVMIDEHFQISLENDAIKNCKNIGDLLSEIEGYINSITLK